MRPTDDEHADGEYTEWHGLPQLISRSIINDDHGIHAWRGYFARKHEDESIRIYREVAVAPTHAELETEGDYVVDSSDTVIAGAEVGRIDAPAGGWESEVEQLPEAIVSGFR